MKNNTGRKFRILFLATGLLLAGIVLAIIVSNRKFYSEHFSENTQINGIDVSKLTPEEAYEKVAIQPQATFTVKGDMPIKKFPVSDYKHINYDIETFETLLLENKFKSVDIKYDFPVTYDLDKLRSDIEALNEGRFESANAYVTFDEESYRYVIVPEIYGNKFDADAVFEKISTNLDGDIEIDLSDYYEAPAILSDDSDLLEEIKKKNVYYESVIEYEVFDGEKLVVDSSVYGPWLNIKEDGSVEIDEKSYNEFIDELYNTYTTVGGERTFNAQTGVKTLKGGTYGWKVDKKKERETLKKEILSGGVVSRRPFFSQEAQAYSKNDVGDTYVEVDIDNQHLYFIKNNEVIITCDVVTGMLYNKERQTQTGVTMVWAMNKDRYLRGPGWKVWVQRFIPFYGGQGFHDASWRNGKFGGEIYKKNGSHGCINMPTDAAIALYDEVFIGCPVVAYSSLY